MMEDKEEMIRIITSDGKEYALTKSIICQSNLIKNIIEDLDCSEMAIPLPNITSTIMDIVIKYAAFHKNELSNNRTLKDIDEKDVELMKMDHKKLFEVILAANYLDLQGLLDLGCKTIANDLSSKTIDEVEKDYDIPLENRFTPEEREAIELEMKWVNGE
jgi:S-phase kinase-associated protein 1